MPGRVEKANHAQGHFSLRDGGVMSVTKIICPNCSTPLRLSQELMPGQVIRCPRCTASIAAQSPSVQPPPMHFAPPPPMSNGYQPMPHGYPPMPHHGGGTEAPPNRAALLAIIIGCLVLLAGGSIGLAYLFSGSGSDK